MNRVLDPRLADILEYRFSDDVPKEVLDGAHRIARRLLACHTWGDVTFTTDPIELEAGEFAAPILGKWSIIFTWDEEAGANRLRLQRL